MIPPEAMQAILGVLIGLGLSAACGFRVFVPMLAMSIAAMAGHLNLSHGFAWIGTWPALVAFGVATATEITAYYVPWLDHLLDTLAIPTAIVAGIIATAACVGDMSPMFKWSLAIIGGGGAAAAVQGLTVVARSVSTAVTGGFANFLVATGEAVGSAILAALAIIFPILAALVVMVFVVLMIMLIRRFLKRRKQLVATTT